MSAELDLERADALLDELASRLRATGEAASLLHAHRVGRLRARRDAARALILAGGAADEARCFVQDLLGDIRQAVPDTFAPGIVDTSLDYLAIGRVYLVEGKPL